MEEQMADEATPDAPAEGTFDRDGAISALEAGFAAGETPVTEPEGQVDDPGTPDPEQQTDDGLPVPDLSDLDPAARAAVEARIRDFQRGWTERTTKLSDANRILQAAGGDPENLMEAYTFQQMLMDEGPDGVEARARLLQALTNGATPQPQETAEEDPFADYDLPPEIRDRLNQVGSLNERLSRFEAAQEEAAAREAHQTYVNEIVADLDERYGEMVEAFPDLAGNSVEEGQAIEEEIMALGAFTGGDLGAALDLYRRIEGRALSRLEAGAVSVPGGATTPPAGGGHSTTPVEINSIKDAGAATKEYLERAFAEGQ
jgi:hypothetical protein